MIPGVSAGSKKVGAREKWTAHVIWPSGAAADGAAPVAEMRKIRTATRRTRAVLIGSMSLQLHVFVRCGKRPAGNEPETRLGHARALRVDEAELPDRRVDHLLVDELLDPMEDRLASLPVELAGLLAKEPVDVGIAAVDEGAAPDDESLETDRRIPEGAAAAVQQVLQLLLLVRLAETW